MPKKQARQISKAETSTAVPQTISSTTGQVFSSDFNPDYSHIMRDLKRIAVLAVSFVVILVALSFFIK